MTEAAQREDALFAFGIVCHVLGCIGTSLGLCLQKVAHVHLEDTDIAYYKSRKWFLGIGTYLSSQILTALAFMFAAQSALAPLLPTTLIANNFFAKKLLNEQITKHDIRATVAMFIAAACVVAGAPVVDPPSGDFHDNLDHLFVDYLLEPVFVITAIVIASMMFLTYVVIQPGRRVKKDEMIGNNASLDPLTEPVGNTTISTTISTTPSVSPQKKSPERLSGAKMSSQEGSSQKGSSQKHSSGKKSNGDTRIQVESTHTMTGVVAGTGAPTSSTAPMCLNDVDLNDTTGHGTNGASCLAPQHSFTSNISQNHSNNSTTLMITHQNSFIKPFSTNIWRALAERDKTDALVLGNTFLSGIYSGWTVTFFRCTTLLLKDVAGNGRGDHVLDWPFWFFAFLAVATGMAMVHCVNMGMKFGESTIVVPVNIAFSLVFQVVLGLMYWQEYNSFDKPQWLVFFFVGVTLAIVSALYPTMARRKQAIADIKKQESMLSTVASADNTPAAPRKSGLSQLSAARDPSFQHEALSQREPIENGQCGGMPGYCGVVEQKEMLGFLLEIWPQFRIGGSLWPSGALLARWFVENKETFPEQASYLELGAGVGLPGLTAGRHLRAQRVTLTDFKDLQDLMRKNIENNFTSSSNVRMEARPLDWSSCAPGKYPFPGVSYDYVIGADIIYVEEQDPLIDALEGFLLNSPSSTPNSERSYHESNTGTAIHSASGGEGVVGRINQKQPTVILAYRERSCGDREYLETKILPRFRIRSGYVYNGEITKPIPGSSVGVGSVGNKSAESIEKTRAQILEVDNKIRKGAGVNVDLDDVAVSMEELDEHDRLMGRTNCGECEIYILADFQRAGKVL